MWSDVLEIARSAHAAFADQVVVGWDVAVLESGPQMIEGNKSPDLDIIQRTQRGADRQLALRRPRGASPAARSRSTVTAMFSIRGARVESAFGRRALIR